jgi:hypothetical protein
LPFVLCFFPQVIHSTLFTDALILTLAFVYGGGLTAGFFFGSAVFAAFASALFSGVVPVDVLVMLKTLNLPLFCASRLPQIYANWKVQQLFCSSHQSHPCRHI